MNADRVLESMALPPRALVNHRVPKKLISEKGARSAADRQLINEGIERVDWRASLKPATVGISASPTDSGGTQEIAVLTVLYREHSNTGRLAEILHRSIPYSLVTVADTAEGVVLSVAEKRQSKSGAEQMVIEGDVVEATVTPETESSTVADLGAALAIDARRHRDLTGLYEYWMDVAIALKTSAISGEFKVPDSHAEGLARWKALRSYERLEAEIEAIRNRADKETQMARKVELNLELQQLRSERTAVMEQI